MTTHALTKNAYQYDANRVYLGLVYAHLDHAESDKQGKGVYNLPANAVWVAPPADGLQPRHVWRLNAGKTNWTQTPWYAGAEVQDLTTGELGYVADSAAPPGAQLPDGLSVDIKPKPEAGEHQVAQWDAESKDWQLVADYEGHTYWLADGSRHTINQVGVSPPEGALDAPPPPTLEQVQATKRAAIETHFTSQLDLGVEVAGKRYDCDATSQQRFTSAVTLAQAAAQAGLDFAPISWTLANNTIHTFASLAELLQTAMAVGAHVQSLFAVRNTHKSAVLGLVSSEAVDAYDFRAGWPQA